MSFQRPSLQAIIDRVKGDFRAELQITSILRRTFLGALAKAIAGVSHVLHGHLVFISKQIFPDQAEQQYLERWAGIYGVERKAATYSQILIDIVFTDIATIPVGTEFKLSDGKIYFLNAEITSTGAETISGQVTAGSPGSDYNLLAGDLMSLTSPIGNIESDATVTAIAVEGEDQEGDQSLRARVIARIQQPPAGGTANDYIQETLSVAGVTRAWVSPGLIGEGTVVIYFVEDNDSPIIPDAAKIAEVQSAIDLFKPVTADAIVVAPIEKPLNLTIAISPNTITVQNAIIAEIKDLILRESNVSGSYKTVGSTYTGKLLLSKINEAISIAAGEEDHVLISPIADIEPTTGELITFGSITFQPLV